MYEDARRYREDRKAKAERLASGDPHAKVDSSSWTPPELLEAGSKTGLKPVSPRQFRKGGRIHHVEGEHEARRADRKARKEGGRATANAIATVNEKAANKEEFGAEHIGALRHGGRARAHKLYGGPLSPSIASGYAGLSGTDVPSSRMSFQNGPSQMSKALGVKSGGRTKRAKGGRTGKLLGGGLGQPGGLAGQILGGGFPGGAGAPPAGTASPLSTPQVMPNIGSTPFGAGFGQMPTFNQGQEPSWMQGPRQELHGPPEPAANPTAFSSGAMSPQLTRFDNTANQYAQRFGMPQRARGGKIPEGLTVEHKIVKKAKGGGVHGEHTEHHAAECRCAKCSGGRMAKGGHVEIHHPDCGCAKCNPVYGGMRPEGGRVARAEGGRADHWIAGATKNKGALHRALHVPEGEKIPAKKLQKAEHSKSPTMRERADLAETLKGLHKAEGGRIARAKGGRSKGKMNVNIVIAPGHSGAPAMNPMAMPGAGAPRPAQPVPMQPPPMMPGGMPMPYPMPMGTPSPMGGAGLGPMPQVPQGMGPGLPRKRGGRAYAGPTDEEGGSGGGLGRLKKVKAYGNEARGAGPNQAV